MVASFAILVIIQVFSRPTSSPTFFEWKTYVVQTLLMLYTIIIYSGTLGPT